MATHEVMSTTPPDSKRFGRYYTPETVAQAMVDWAIRDSSCTVLDPSFGGCAFFRTSLRTLRRLGAKNPGRLLYGVDIDPGARTYLAPLLTSGADSNQFRTEDFLETKPCKMSQAPYSVVVGNPPYVRHHNVEGKFALVRALGSDDGTTLSARASYWAYFVLHSLDFIAPGGRFAMVLPGAFLHADYAATVRQRLARTFSKLTIILIRERLFADAEENSVVVLAEGRGFEHKELRVTIADSAQDLGPICHSVGRRTTLVSDSSGKEVLSAFIGKSVLGTYQELRTDSRVAFLDKLASVRIGTVTGANGFFIVTEAQSRQLHIPNRCLKPIVKRATFLRGLSFTRSDHSRLLRRGEAALLLKLTDGRDVSRQMAAYLRLGKEEGIHERYKCSIRTKWYRIDEPHSPDAFLQYMSSETPRLVLNPTKVACTNAIHELTWKARVPGLVRRSLAMSSLSALFRLSAELEGRSYGGGVLKVEPSEAKRLLLMSLPDGKERIAARFSGIDALLRAGKRPEATELADRLFLRDGLGLSKAIISELNAACENLKGLRLPRQAPNSLSKIA